MIHPSSSLWTPAAPGPSLQVEGRAPHESRGAGDRQDARRGAARTSTEIGGGSPFSVSDLVYVDCPECGRKIAEPFMPTSTPIACVHAHRRGRPNARLVVIPVGPGGEPVVHVVSRHERLEDVLVRISRRVR